MHCIKVLDRVIFTVVYGVLSTQICFYKNAFHELNNRYATTVQSSEDTTSNGHSLVLLVSKMKYGTILTSVGDNALQVG